MLKMVGGTGIIGVDMVCPLGGTVSTPQPPNYDNIEMEGVGSLMFPNSLKAPLERVELIGNSVQGENPSPDNPQEIKSCGRKSKNIFNKNAAKQGYEFGSAASDIETVKQGWFVSDFMPVKATTYLISGKKTGLGCKLYNKDKVFVKNTQAAFGGIKFDEGIAYFRINGEIKDLDNIQVEEGNDATDYEPYGYFFDLKITGKNLLSNKSAEWQIGKGASWSTYPKDAIIIFSVINSAVNVINLKPSTTYSIVNNSGEIVISRIIERDSSENGIKDHDVRHSKYTFVTNQNTMNAILQFKKVDGTELLSSDIESIKIMLVEGEANEPTPYQPYTEQSVQIALDEPLRGVGEYKDTITKDGVVRKIKRIVLDGSENWWIHKEKENTVSFYTNSFKFLFPTHNTMFVDKFSYAISGMNKEDISWSVYGDNFFININKSDASNLVDFKTWLSKNPVTVEYIAKEPITEPLPESVQAQLQALHSENGTTHIFVDSGEVPCGIKLTYRKEK